MRGSTNAQTNHEGLYLPLSGGTVHNTSSTTPLILKSGNQYYSFIGFTRSTGGTVYLGSFNGKPVFNDGSNHELAYKSDLESIQDQLTVDTVPTSGSSNLITSGAVYEAFNNAGYVSNQIVPLGVFVVTLPCLTYKTYVSNSNDSSNFRYVYSNVYTYKSSTTRRNKSGNKIQITSSDSITDNWTKSSSGPYNSWSVLYLNNCSFTIPVDSSVIPDGSYVINAVCKPVIMHRTSSSNYTQEMHFLQKYGGNEPDEIIMSINNDATVTNGMMNLSITFNTGTVFTYYAQSSDTSLTMDVAICFTEILQQS